jgi:hypothetical protein
MKNKGRWGIAATCAPYLTSLAGANIKLLLEACVDILSLSTLTAAVFFGREMEAKVEGKERKREG